LSLLIIMEENILEKIHVSALKFLDSLTPEETFKTIADEAVNLVLGDYASILIDQNGELKKVYASKPIGYTVKNRKQGNACLAFIQRKPIIAHISDMGVAHPQLKTLGIKSGIFIPLSYKKKALGVLVVNSKLNQKFTTRELNILKLFGSLASLSVRKTQLYDETKKALELRDEFISLAAHELRTPMTTISGYIQLLHGKLVNSNSSEAKWTEELLRESRRLTNIVSELVEVNRINAGKYHFNLSEVNLVGIVGKSINRFLLVNNNYKIDFNNTIKPQDSMIIADQEKILMVINSLLDNAAKFSPTESVINISLKSNSRQLILVIQDHGKGISEEELDNLFQSFRKEQTGSGLGLGLFLSKNIIEKHKGEISVKSKKDKGTKVEIKLPKIKI